MNSSKRAKYRARAKNNRAKIEGKTQGKGKGKTTNYYFPDRLCQTHIELKTFIYCCVTIKG